MATSNSPVHLVLSDEPFLLQRAEAELLRGIPQPGPSSLNTLVLDAAEAGTEVIGFLQTMAMLGGPRVAVIRRFEGARVDFLDALLNYLENPNPRAFLFMFGAKLPPPAPDRGGEGEAGEGTGKNRDRGKVISNKLSATGGFSRLDKRGEPPLEIIRKTAKAEGCSIRPEAASYLLSLIGDDLGMLVEETRKVALWMGGQGEIGLEAIQEVCAPVAELEGFELMLAIAQRNRGRALELTHRLFEQAGGDNAAHPLLGLLAWKMRQVLEVQQHFIRKTAVPPALERTRRELEPLRAALVARPLSAARIMRLLSEATRKFHRTTAGARPVFEMLVLELTTEV
jgi:DNA polymerase III delta subunit